MTTERRRRTAKSAEPAKSATLRHPQATSLSMLDGAAAAVVAGPVSMMPEEWVCPLLGVDPDDFNHDTETFSAIAAALTRHNAIVNALSTKPESFEPLFVRTPNGEVDARAWCMGFYAVIKLRLLAWSRLMSPNATEHGLLLPILFHCVDPSGRPVLDPHRRRLDAPSVAHEPWRDIPTVVEAMRQGRTTARGHRFEAGRVAHLRNNWRIPCFQRKATVEEGDVMTVAAAAAALDVAPSTVHRWLNDGFIQGEQATPGAPWRIRVTDELKARFGDPAGDGFVTTQEATRILGVTRQTVLHRV
jgi:uncharacterized protein